MEVSLYFASQKRAFSYKKMANDVANPGNAETTGKWGVLGTLTFCHFVNDYYAMIIPPMLPLIAREFELSFFQSGLLVFMANIVSAFLQPIAGYVADIKMRRRLIIIIGLLLYGIMSVALGLAPNYMALLVVLFLMGIGGSTYHPQSTFYVALYFRRLRATASGIHGISNPLGFVIAPISVTLLIALTGSWRTAAMVLVIPALIAALVAWRVLDEPQIEGAKGFFTSFGSGPLILLSLVTGIALAVFMGFTTFLPFYSQGGNSVIPGSWWLPLALLPGVASQPLGGFIADRIGRRNTVVLGLGTLAGALLGFVNSSGGTALVFSMAAGTCLGLLPPVCLIYAAELAVGRRVGTAVGILWGFSMGMGALAPLWVGYLRDLFPDFRMAFITLVCIAFAGAIMAFFLPGSKRDLEYPY